MQYAWLTDIHLNFIDSVVRQRFYQEIVDTKCDGVLISGDIAEAPCVVNILNEMVRYIDRPIYFVLGNHDYYKRLVYLGDELVWQTSSRLYNELNMFQRLDIELDFNEKIFSAIEVSKFKEKKYSIL